MKKILIAIGLAATVAVSAQAQGLVIFSSAAQNSSTNGATVGKIAGVGNYYFALFYSATATTVSGSSTPIQGTNGAYAFSDSNWTLLTATIATNTSTAGRFIAAAPNADGSSTIPGIAAGNSAQFVVVGWSANLGNTVSALTQALAVNGTTGFLGESVVSGAITLGNGGLVPTPGLFGPALPAIQGFTLGAFTITSTPEPGTLALAALGGASLLMFRRKNK
jgi:hypothetical protein